MKFPDGFVWGAATAAFQIEGASDVDGRGRSIWDELCDQPGAILDASDGSVACDHYNRWPEDLDIVADLGLGAYRFSIAWPRIVPLGDGVIEQRGLDFYSRLVDGMLERGITPYATLYHWDLPQALQDSGGWTSRDTARRFADYASVVHQHLSDRVTYWSTLNEPWCSAFLGYASGEHAPGRTEPAEAISAVHHLMLAHGLGIQAMRANSTDSQLGIVVNMYDVQPASESPADLDAARRLDGQQNRWYLDAIFRGTYPQDIVEDYRTFTDFDFVVDGDAECIAEPIDFLGINYYSSFMTRGLDAPKSPLSGERPTPWVGCDDVEFVDRGLAKTHMGWDVIPDGLTATLERVARDYPVPSIYVMENGAAYPDEVTDGRVHDVDRTNYIEAHLKACSLAVSAGVPLDGYFVWSLLDNFEWAWGYERRFGVVRVDYETQERIVKDSALAYSAIVRANRWSPDESSA